MANFEASFEGLGSGFKRSWKLVFDDVANTITVQATYTTVDGGPAPDPRQFDVIFELNSHVDLGVDFLTGKIVAPNNPAIDGRPFEGGSTATKILNAAPRTRPNVRASISADRAAAMKHTTNFVP